MSWRHCPWTATTTIIAASDQQGLPLCPTVPPAELAERFAREGVRDVECMIADVSGYPRGKLVPAASFLAGAELRLPQAIPMQCVTGEYSYDDIFPDADPDILLVPDYASVRRAPWAQPGNGGSSRYLALHDCYELTGEPCLFSARMVLKGVVERFRTLGLTPVVAPEIEFYLTAPCDDPAQPLGMPVSPAGRSEVGQSAFSLNLLNEQAGFWNEFNAALETLGIRGDTWIHEVGASQYEINLLHGDPVDVADQAFLFKYAAKEIALRHGLNAVFMAKPIAGQAGSSMHLHQSVVDAGGRNVFSDADGNATETFMHYLGGLQRYLPDLMLVFAPFVNSFRRYVVNSLAPVNLHWGYDNRTTGLRIPKSPPAARRIENRIAGADANPYLAIAASITAGLAGIEEKLAPSEPIEGSGYARGHDLAMNFVVAHDALSSSKSAPRLLGERFVRAYLAVKGVEYNNFNAEISAWERRFLVPQV